MEYNHYCHFVPGFVGEGRSHLFEASGLEQPELATEIQLSHRMGLFLQKVNIICDYLEDYVDGHAWWPQPIWKQHSPSGELVYFPNQDNPGLNVKTSLCGFCCCCTISNSSRNYIDYCLTHSSVIKPLPNNM
jgi:phytoene/squalene synthetase